MERSLGIIEFADQIANRLQEAVANLPEGFHGSFGFTQTGNNLTHPFTVGLLSRILWGIPRITHVAFDLRLNLGSGVKFQPDLAGLDTGCHPVGFVDYESPNSSDSRLPSKDVDAYTAWRQRSGISAPYVIITTLPNRAAKDWELRYTAPGYYNERFRDRKGEIRQNPYRFWYCHFLNEFTKRDMKDIALVNIDGKAVRRAYPT